MTGLEEFSLTDHAPAINLGLIILLSIYHIRLGFMIRRLQVEVVRLKERAA